MSTDNENIFGPGTDLVISLFSIALILIGIISGLYLESVNSQTFIVATQQNEQSLNKELQKKLASFEALLKTEEMNNDELKVDISKLMAKISKLSDMNMELIAKNVKTKKRLAIVCKGQTAGDCGGSTKKPKRSKEGKYVYTLILQSNNRNDLKFRTDDQSYRQIAREEAHRIFKRAKRTYGKRLYVAIDTEEMVYTSLQRELICEFRRYDYYEHYNKAECSRYR